MAARATDGARASKWATLLIGLALVSCVGAIVEDDGEQTPALVRGGTAFEYCAAACQRAQECDDSRIVEACVDGCQRSIVPRSARFRADFLQRLSSCFVGEGCADVLDGSAVERCTSLAKGDLLPSEAGHAYCSGHLAAAAACNVEFDPADCKHDASAFTDTALAQAADCLSGGCGEMDDCVTRALGSVPLPATSCQASDAPACADSSDLRVCVSGYTETYACGWLCETHGFAAGGCGPLGCQCGALLDEQCTLGADAVCACFECSEDERRTTYIGCASGSLPFVRCYAKHVQDGRTDCAAAAADHCL